MSRHTGFVIVTSALLAAALAVVFLAGCGSDESKARQYIESAQEKNKQVLVNQEKLRQKGLELSKFDSLIQNITPESAATLKQFFADLVKLVEAINTTAQDTRTEYEKIVDLNDVANYKKYARNRIQALDLLAQQTPLVKSYAAIYSTVVDQALNGEPNEEAIKAQAAPIVDELNKLTAEIQKLNDQAADLAKDLKIQ